MEEKKARINQVYLAVREVVWSLLWASCDLCHQPAQRVWEAQRLAIDIDLDHPVLLLVRVSVHHCLPCAHYFRAQPPFLRPDASYTNRVVNKAVQSVYLDGMAMLRVAKRLARDFWVQPSEAMIRVWCRQYSQGLSLEGTYQQWVVKEFSGVLCVDEVYQNELALLLAVDPAAEDGDRLVGYQLVHGKVGLEEMAHFLERLRQAGVEPAEVITDGSALYPTALAKVWPQAAHQLCLFHETRAVTKAVLQVAKAVRKDLPEAPVIRLHSGRIPRQQREAMSKDEANAYDRQTQVAVVHKLKQEGHSLRNIVRQTGHSRNTVRRWLEEEQPAMVLEAEDQEGPEQAGGQENGSVPGESETFAAPTLEPSRQTRVAEEDEQASQATVSGAVVKERKSEASTPPVPWRNWEEVRQFSQALLDDKFLLVKRPEHLTEEEGQRLSKLLSYPGGDKLRLAKEFVGEWYGLWRDEDGQRRSPEEALAQYRTWQDKKEYQALAPLKRVQAKIDEERFAKLSHFLYDSKWEGTNNGAERMGREFRHMQGPHFDLRTEASIEGKLKAKALTRKGPLVAGNWQMAGHSNRGRRRQGIDNGEKVALVAA